MENLKNVNISGVSINDILNIIDNLKEGKTDYDEYVKTLEVINNTHYMNLNVDSLVCLSRDDIFDILNTIEESIVSVVPKADRMTGWYVDIIGYMLWADNEYGIESGAAVDIGDIINYTIALYQYVKSLRCKQKKC